MSRKNHKNSDRHPDRAMECVATTDHTLCGIPEFDASRCRAASRGLGRRRPINFGDKRRLVSAQEVLDAWQAGHERAGKLRKGRRADDHQQGNAVSHDSVALVSLIADAMIMGERDPATLANRLQPLFVGRVRRKVICVPLDRQTGRRENLGKALTEIAIGEIDKAQAARS